MQVIKPLLILKCVHTHPETLVFVPYQLIFFDETLKWFMNEFLSFSKVLEDFIPKHEEPPVNPNTRCGKILDVLDMAIWPNINHMKAMLRFHTQKGGDLILLEAMVDKIGKKEIG
jgi:hypothetical protein